jgi:3-isopropylmalate dehydrogenase
MPGDGVGNDVMEAARLVLDRLKLDAEYVPCDIGWEFWCKEGNALPDRTVKVLKETTCGLFGAITSKPQSEAKEELIPELKGKGLVYFSPIVGLRQMFNLHTNMRPCKSYTGNPLNYRGNKITNPSGEDVPIDQVVFRENTEGSYGGVEFFPLPEPVYTALCANPKMKKWKEKGFENVALSTRIMSKQGCTNICRQAFEFAKKTGRNRVTLIEKPNVLRETGGLMMRCFKEVAKDYPGIRADDANIDAICMWMFKNPQDYSVLVAENMFGDIVSDLCAGLVGGQCEPWGQVRRVRANPRFSTEVRRPIQGQSDCDAFDGQANARLVEGNRNGESPRSWRRSCHFRSESAHLRYGWQEFHTRGSQSRR